MSEEKANEFFDDLNEDNLTTEEKALLDQIKDEDESESLDKESEDSQGSETQETKGADSQQVNQQDYNLQQALQQERQARQTLEQTLKSILERFQQHPGSDTQQHEPELTPEERWVREQAAQAVGPAVMQQQRMLEEIERERQQRLLAENFRNHAIAYSQTQTDYPEAEMFLSKRLIEYAQTIAPNDPNLQSAIIENIRIGMFQHPEGPRALYRVAKFFGYKPSGSQDAVGEHGGQPTTTRPKTLSNAPGARLPNRVRSLQEQAEALLRMDDAQFNKIDTNKVEEILKKLQS